VISVIDRGFSSDDNLRYLQRAGGHYIAGERMRSGMENVEQALSRPGRFKPVARQCLAASFYLGAVERRFSADAFREQNLRLSAAFLGYIGVIKAGIIQTKYLPFFHLPLSFLPYYLEVDVIR
jgi:hypothetical protein